MVGGTEIFTCDVISVKRNGSEGALACTFRDTGDGGIYTATSVGSLGLA